MARTIRVPLTPPINTEGVFTCYPPFELDTNLVFRLEAIRTFPELERRNFKVFEEFYAPRGLDVKIWEEDALVGASILTLKAVDGTVVFVPNTYLESYPGMAGLKYAHNVIVIDVGLVPATIDVKRIAADLEDLSKTGLGVEAKARVDTITYDGNIDHQKHVQMETARRIALNKHVPLSERFEDLQRENEELRRRIDELVDILTER